MAHPPASKSQKIRTGNYCLSWSGLRGLMDDTSILLQVAKPLNAMYK